MNQDNLHLEDILSDRFVEENYLEIPLAERVFRIFTFIAGAIVVLVLIQLTRIGFAKQDLYRERAFANMSDTNFTVAPRGIIFDRFDVPLTQNEQSFRAILIPSKLPQEPNARKSILLQMAKMLGGSEEELNRKIKNHDWDISDRIVLVNELTYEQLIAFSSLPLDAFAIEESFKRAQKTPRVFSHVLGYTGFVNENDLRENQELSLNDSVGRSGIEGYYDSYLRGKNGKKLIVRDAKGMMIEEQIIAPSRIGASVKTFIDADLQNYFYERLRNMLTSLGRDTGIGIVMNPKNGEVLSLVSIPSFDARTIAESLKDPSKPLFNRAISGLYTPGSTIKPLVAVAALAEEVIAPWKEIFSEGFIELPNPYNPDNPSRFLDWKPHGWVDLYAAIARSSNVYFYEIGGGFQNQRGLGITTLKKWWREFGLENKTDIDLVGEKNGFLPDPDWKQKSYRIPWRIGDTYNVSIGQGDLLITPLELLNYINAIANGGTLYKPRVVDKIIDGEETLLETKPIAIKELGAEVKKILPEIQRGMEDAVQKSYGTAHLLSGIPMSIAAKTGSAQVANNTRTNAFFVGYTDDLSVLVLIENAREGSLNAVPVAKDIFLWYYNNRIKNSKS